MVLTFQHCTEQKNDNKNRAKACWQTGNVDKKKKSHQEDEWCSYLFIFKILYISANENESKGDSVESYFWHYIASLDRI